jgi:branched-chain amino acid transport system substrate-binding protein
LAAILIVGIAGAAFFLMRRGDDTPAAFEIGVLMPMTGSGSVWGQNGQRAVRLAVDEINASGGVHGRPVSLVFEDTRSVPRDAVSAFRRVVDERGVRLVVVDMISSDVLAIAPIAERQKVLIISPGASNPAITTAGDFVFRNWPSDALQGVMDARYAREVLGWKRAAVLAIRNDYGDALTAVFKDTFEKAGGKVVYADTFAQGESVFRPLVARLRSQIIDGVFLPGYPQEIPVLVSQLREQGVTTPLLGTESFQDVSVVSGAGKAIEGAVYSIPKSPDGASPRVQAFRESFKQRFGEDPGVPADVVYDALHLLVEGARSAPPTATGPALAEAVRDYLYKVRDYGGASGLTNFDANGDAIKPFEFRTIRDGRFVPTERQIDMTDGAKP